MISFKTNVYRNEWLDLVFAKRNQLYGAYELRRDYSARLSAAMLISATLFTGLISGPFIYQKFKGPTELRPDQSTIVMQDTTLFISQPPAMEKPKPEEPAPRQSAPAQEVATQRFVRPVAAVEEQVVEDMPTITDLKEAAIGTATTEGDPAGQGANPLPAGEPGGTGGNGTAAEPEDNSIRIGVEKSPEFPGGHAAFAKFIQKNLRYPELASENQVQGRVTISFVVEKNGSISNVKLMKGIGFGCDEEAIRVLKKSPSWVPGEQNGQKVRVQYTVPLMFTAAEQ